MKTTFKVGSFAIQVPATEYIPKVDVQIENVEIEVEVSGQELVLYGSTVSRLAKDMLVMIQQLQKGEPIPQEESYSEDRPDFSFASHFDL